MSKTLPDGLSTADQRTRFHDCPEGLQGFAGVDGVFSFAAQDHGGPGTRDMVLVRTTGGKRAHMPEKEW